MSDYTIRSERPEDYREVENLVRESFWNVYRPGCLEHYLVHVLRDNPDFVAELDFVLIRDDEIIGQIMYVKSHIEADSGKNVPVMTMGPICILPEYQRMGYGKILLDYSLKEALKMGCGAVCFEGNYDFYSKSGFRHAREYGLRYRGLDENDDDSFFLCRELTEGYLDEVTGVYGPPEVYLVDEVEALKFDEKFPPKERLILEGQIF